MSDLPSIVMFQTSFRVFLRCRVIGVIAPNTLVLRDHNGREHRGVHADKPGSWISMNEYVRKFPDRKAA
jgi:hypothetical protein